ncbi:MAG: rhomboid family intramembrane serine protease [Bacteroidales bacterium]|nr:rhomboid family intramembrane serine protease [Bacteroidales bacterium]
MEGSDISAERAFQKKKLLLSMIIPGIFIFLMWIVKIIEVLFGADFSGFGIYPLTAKGLTGILFSPFIHSDFNHLFNNSIPLFFLSVALFYLYSEVALKIFSLTFFLTGLLVWVAGRDGWHIGASGMVYGLASFLFFSGIIRKHFRLIALSLLIVFLYGSMVWGIFPGIYKNVSWESHMLGLFSGIVLSIIYRNEGPQQPVAEWMKEEEEETGEEGEWEKGREKEEVEEEEEEKKVKEEKKRFE